MKSCLLLSMLLFAGLACSFLPGAAAPTVLPAPVPTPEICSDRSPGLSIQVQFGKTGGRGQRVTISGVGFQPAEQLTIRLSARGGTNGYEIEASRLPVQEDGTFSYETTLPLDHPNMLWEAHVVHRRGIACLRFVSPS